MPHINDPLKNPDNKFGMLTLKFRLMDNISASEQEMVIESSLDDCDDALAFLDSQFVSLSTIYMTL